MKILSGKHNITGFKINSKPSAEDKRSLYYAEAPRDCNEVKINTKPSAEGKRSLHYAGAPRDCNEVKIKKRSAGADGRGKMIRELAYKLELLVGNPALCRKLGRAGRKKFKACYDLPLFKERICSLYRSIGAD